MNQTLQKIKEIFSEALICDVSDLDIFKPYVEMGVDSILAIQIVKLVYHYFKLKVKSSDIFNSSSISEFAAFIEKKLLSTYDLSQISLSRDSSPQSDEQGYAIVGISGYFPQSSTVELFWKNLIRGRDSIAECERFSSSWKGGFLENAEFFDPAFFDISPKEAKYMDPQQRLFLQVAWNTFEDAGLTRTQLNEYNCGVFVGSLPGDYKYLLSQDKDNYSTHAFAGNSFSAISGRISYIFNLKGPSLSIDTACSTSLVCLDSALQALKNQNCEAALVGAASIFSTPEIFHFAIEANFLSKSSQCSVFDVKADGFIPAEAVCGILIKSTQKALEDGDQIYAIIRGSGVNHDGRTNGIMSPNSNSQRQLIESIYSKFKINPDEIGYIEAHGTGTPIGDPIETTALQPFFTKNHENPTYLGSCKANVGHALTASGMVSLIKCLLILKYKQIPPQIHLSSLNPEIDKGSLQIAKQARPFPDEKKYVCLSAFGFTGTNAHVVLERPPKQNIREDQNNDSSYIFIFSARSHEILIEVLKNFLNFLKENKNIDLYSASYTLTCCRTFFREARWGIIAGSFKELYSQIEKKLTTIHDNSSDETVDHFYKNDPELVKNLEEVLNLKTTDLRPILLGNFKTNTRKISLPPYPFKKEKFWPEKTEPLSDRQRKSETHLTNGKIYSNNIQKEELEETIKSKIASLLDYKIEDVDIHKPFEEFGLDSLIAAEIIKPLRAKFSSLSLKDFFRYNTITKLSQFLSEQYQGNDKIEDSKQLLKLETFVPVQIKISNTMEYVLCGEGELLIFLPPLNTTADAWIQQVRYFINQKKKILIPHYPFHSISKVAEEKQEIDFLEIAKQTLTIAQSEAPHQQKFSFFGWSLGGCLSLILAKYFPDKIKSIILINTAAAFPPDLFGETIELRKDLEKSATYLQQIFLSDQDPVKLIQSNCPLSQLQQYYQALEQFDIKDSIDKIQIPTLITYGKLDPVIKERDIEVLLKIPNAKLLVFETEGHFAPLTIGPLFNVEVLRFLNSLEFF